jgi:hypothetical protein
MKIARIVLTATILLSLNSTLFCSSEKATETNKLQRKDSFDPARDGGALNGWLGWTPDDLTDHTLKNLKKDYQGKEIRPGKGSKALAIWEKFGKEKVVNLETAELFTAAMTYSQLQLSPEAQVSANKFLETKKMADAAAKQTQFEQAEKLNNDSISLLYEYHLKALTRVSDEKAEDDALDIKYKALREAEKNNLKMQRIQNAAKLVETLHKNFDDIVTIETSSNITIPKKFAASKSSIAKEKLSKLSTKFKDGIAQPISYAEMAEAKK